MPTPAREFATCTLILMILPALAFALMQMSKGTVPDQVFKPLWLYQGNWQVRRANAGSAAPDKLNNQCASLGHYFTCQQTVDGKVAGLVIFIPADQPNHFYTQTIMPEGRATGRDDLEIQPDHWVFTSSRLEAGRTTYFRTTNTFNGPNHIHFERAESTDGKTWQTKDSGDEKRIGPASAH